MVLSIAFAIRDKASSVNSNLTFSKAKIFDIALLKHFLVLLKFQSNSLHLRSSKVAITGSLPTNSGIKPNFNRSSVSSFFKI